MKIITSVHNPEIKDIVKLHEAKTRKEKNLFIAEGIRVCDTLINSGAKLEQLYVTEKQKDFALNLINQDYITLVSEPIMQKITTSTTPSGLLGVFKKPQKPSLNLLSNGIVLAQISDPGNMGTLIRSAAAMGVKTVVTVEGVDPWNPKAIQSSAGTIAQVNIFEPTWTELLKNKKNLKLTALVVSGGKSPNELDFKNNLLVVGSEAHGIPESWISDCDNLLTLPMEANVESLNAAVAGSIALYLAFGQK